MSVDYLVKKLVVYIILHDMDILHSLQVFYIFMQFSDSEHLGLELVMLYLNWFIFYK